MSKGLEKTAPLWPDIRRAYEWLCKGAEILENAAGQKAAEVKQRYTDFLQDLRQRLEQAGSLKSALEHFLKVSDSSLPGLFHCYDVEGLPRTNNDLEQLFGSVRHHERRVSGQKKASSNLVLRGAVRLIACVLTLLAPPSPQRLFPRDLQAWREQRRSLQQRRHARVLQRRFRRNPEVYVEDLEQRLLRLILPP